MNKSGSHLKDIINSSKKPDAWKIQLKRAISCISSEDNDEERIMHSKIDKIEIMTNDRAEELIEELFQPPLTRYQNGLELRMRTSDFVFGCIVL